MLYYLKYLVADCSVLLSSKRDRSFRKVREVIPRFDIQAKSLGQ
jgi:hypothetical protein